MALVETLITAVGAAVARTTLKRWLEDDEYARDISTSILGILEKKIPDLLTRSKAERDFRRIAEEVAAQLGPFIENEAGGLPENEREAAALAVADSFENARITDKTLFEADLDPKRLTGIIRVASPDVTKDLGAATMALYEKILAECAAYVIEITSTLPSFGHQSTGAMLQREGEIVDLVRKVLTELPKLSQAENGRDADLAFETDYRRAVARKLDRLELFGITTEETSRRYDLSVAYITLTASRGRNADPVDEEDDNGLDFVRVDEALGGSQRVLIRGEAGSGKTTLLQWLAVRAARKDFAGALEDWNGLKPFFLQLRRWLDGDLPTPEQYLRDVAANEKDAMPKGWVNRQLKAGALILIDGIDEVPEDRREKVKAWIDNLVGSFESSRIVVTSRPAAVEEGWLSAEGFDDTELQPMDRTDIEALIDQWHDAARQELKDETRLGQLDDYKQSLKATIRASRPIRNLATTPLLCAMICTLHLDRRKNIPNNRMKLYRIALDMLLDRRDTEREAAFSKLADLDQEAKESLLRRLAYWLMRNGLADSTRARMEERLSEYQKSLADVDHHPAVLLQYLLERSGLLREPVKGRIDFIHRTFLEYLAGWQAVREGDVDVLIENAHRAEWRETVILAAGHASEKDGNRLVGGLLERAEKETDGQHQLILIAVGCLATATDLSRDLRDKTQTLLGRIMPPKKIAEARATAEAGDLAVPYLKVAANSKPGTIVACITALGLIGGDQAIDVLRSYVGDERKSVSKALFKALSDLDALEVMASASALRLTGLTELPDLALIRNLKSLDLSGCRDLTSLAGLECLTSLQSLNLRWCDELTSLAGLESLTSLQSLDLNRCSGLTSLEGLEGLTSLQSLCLFHCSGLTSLKELKGLTSLQSLDLGYCRGLTSLTHLEGLCSLQSLGLVGWQGQTLPVGLNVLPSLQSLDLSYCRELTSFMDLQGLTSLQFLDLTGCWSLISLTGLESLHSLRTLDIWGCWSLQNLDPLCELRQLEKIKNISEELLATLPPDHPARQAS